LTFEINAFFLINEKYDPFLEDRINLLYDIDACSLFGNLLLFNSSVHLTGSEACCADISVTGCLSVHDLYAAHVGFPVSLSASADLGTGDADMAAVKHSFCTKLALCHLKHLLKS
jgi:hypothetical protein